jgi:uncharacterized membrane protein
MADIKQKQFIVITFRIVLVLSIVALCAISFLGEIRLEDRILVFLIIIIIVPVIIEHLNNYFIRKKTRTEDVEPSCLKTKNKK